MRIWVVNVKGNGYEGRNVKFSEEGKQKAMIRENGEKGKPLRLELELESETREDVGR